MAPRTGRLPGKRDKEEPQTRHRPETVGIRSPGPEGGTKAPSEPRLPRKEGQGGTGTASLSWNGNRGNPIIRTGRLAPEPRPNWETPPERGRGETTDSSCGDSRNPITRTRPASRNRCLDALPMELHRSGVRKGWGQRLAGGSGRAASRPPSLSVQQFVS